MIIRIVCFSLASLLFLPSKGQLEVQSNINVLFLGNSYTAYNNLPQLVADCAASTNRMVNVQSNTPGGYTFQGHSTNNTSIELISQGDWDFVVLQEQSQLPSFPDFQVSQDVYPYASKLNDTILYFNECAETVFYMTWGRENGDSQNCANWPPVCTYEGMDDLLNERYRQMAEDNEAIISPVGAVWRNIRTNYPDLDLYASDGSHPSAEGSYAAAVAFYTVLFREDPTEITFDFSVAAEEAAIIRQVVKEVVYNHLLAEWHVGEYDNLEQLCFLQLEVEEPTSSNLEQALYTSGNTLYIKKPAEVKEVILYDLSGKEVVRVQTMGACEYATNLASGYYIASVLTEDNIVQFQKILLN